MQLGFRHAITSALLAFTTIVAAEAPGDFLIRFETEARQSIPQFAASAERGQQFFRAFHTNELACSSCHTRNPAAPGRHAVTGRPIEPLAPAANASRFTSTRKVDKWFRRNCGDVLGRECTAAEKADVLAFLISAKP